MVLFFNIGLALLSGSNMHLEHSPLSSVSQQLWHL